ncbi:MAG: hypothetical protein ACMXYK_03800 [Candidatus Woesearchaeota archaeon]
MAHLKPTIYHLGIDETTLGMPSGNTIIVAAQTTTEKLIQERPHGALLKSKDYIVQSEKTKNPVVFPLYDDMKKTGLETFHWTRVCGGRFKPRELQHASIAHVVHTNGYKAHNTVLHIDAFENRHDKTRFLIQEYLHRRGFFIPFEHIVVWGGGDKCIPLINYADIIGANIGLSNNNKYQKYNTSWKNVPFEAQEIPFEKNRCRPLSTKDRDDLDSILDAWKNKTGNLKKVRLS